MFRSRVTARQSRNQKAHVHNRAVERWRPRRLARRRLAAEDLATNVQICEVERCRLGG
jgi:hypothetical protein